MGTAISHGHWKSLPVYLETDSLSPLRKASLEMKGERSSDHGGDLQRDKSGVPGDKYEKYNHEIDKIESLGRGIFETGRDF